MVVLCGKGRGPLARPAAAFGHVQKQAVVLPAQHVHPVARTGLRHDVRIGNAAGHHVGVGAAGAALRLAALLKDPVQGLARRQLRPARCQRGANGGQLLVADRGKTGEHEDGRVGVQRPGLTAGMPAAAPVENALGIGCQRHGGDGVKQGLHGGNVEF